LEIINEESISFKRTHIHPPVAGQSGIGKTSLMQRGCVRLMDEHFKSKWTGRSFAWDLKREPMTVSEKALLNDDKDVCVLALRCFYQSLAIPDDYSYDYFLMEFMQHLEKNRIGFDHIKLDVVLGHVDKPPAVPTPAPYIVILNISDTNEILKGEASQARLKKIIKVVYHYNLCMSLELDSRHLLITTFDGTYKKELRDVARGCHDHYFMIPLTQRGSIHTQRRYEALFAKLFALVFRPVR
jgi:hypothetical protein